MLLEIGHEVLGGAYVHRESDFGYFGFENSWR
jgi:hypothetical protein